MLTTHKSDTVMPRSFENLLVPSSAPANNTHAQSRSGAVFAPTRRDARLDDGCDATQRILRTRTYKRVRYYIVY